MVKVTELAKQQLKRLADTKLDRADTIPRLVLSGARTFGLIADLESDGDQRVEHGGRVILLIGPELSRQLDRSALDWEETPHHAGLVIKRPSTPPGGAPAAGAHEAGGRGHHCAA